MKTVIEMAQQVEAEGFAPVVIWPEVRRLCELVRADSRNATLDEIATKIEAMPFGDTAASFAVWVREQKK